MIRGGLGHLDCYQITWASNFPALRNLEVDQAVILSSSSLAMSLRVLTTFSGGNQHFYGLSNLLLVLLPRNVVHKR
jgi:hypothetical protein